MFIFGITFEVTGLDNASNPVALLGQQQQIEPKIYCSTKKLSLFRGCSSGVERSLRMRDVLGSIPSISTFYFSTSASANRSAWHGGFGTIFWPDEKVIAFNSDVFVYFKTNQNKIFFDWISERLRLATPLTFSVSKLFHEWKNPKSTWVSVSSSSDENSARSAIERYCFSLNFSQVHPAVLAWRACELFDLFCVVVGWSELVSVSPWSPVRLW